jgi:hypothetical protein
MSNLVSDAQVQITAVEKEKPKVKPNYKFMRDKDRELVKGIFRFHEVPGGVMEFAFKKWKQDPVEKFVMKDGMIYTVPLGVAKHLNQNCWYPVHGFMTDENGQPSPKVQQKVRRCSFQSLEFVDVEDFGTTPELTTL